LADVAKPTACIPSSRDGRRSSRAYPAIHLASSPVPGAALGEVLRVTELAVRVSPPP
jgi:hypothetical protein